MLIFKHVEPDSVCTASSCKDHPPIMSFLANGIFWRRANVLCLNIWKCFHMIGLWVF